MFIKCKKCGNVEDIKNFKRNYYICRKCNNYEQVSALERINFIVDEGTFEELDSDLGFNDPINFPEYKEKYNKALTNSGIKEAVIIGKGKINNINLVIGAMDSKFMMGSMGSVVGQKIAKGFELAAKEKLPVVIFSASGGARMQEGIYSLMQMAKTASAVQSFSEKGGFFISILTNPTTGGVSASFAFLGDIILAEPNATIGFAGKRVIQQTINESLPDGFQTSEFLLKRGFIDAIIERPRLKENIEFLLKLHSRKIGR